MKVLAHSGEFLIDHLMKVAKEAEKLGETSSEKFFLYLVGLFHDFGKATTFFQNKILDRNIENNSLAEHSALGALAYLYINWKNWKIIIQRFNLTSLEFVKFVLAGFVSIYLHHQDLKDLDLWLDFLGLLWDETQINNKFSLFKKQASNLVKDFLYELKKILVAKSLEFDFEEFIDFLNNGKIFVFIRKLQKILKNYDFDWCQFAYFVKKIYSNLIYADKYKTIFQNIEKQIDTKLPADLIDQYRSAKWFDKSKTTLNRLRNEVYQIVNEKIEKFDLSNHFLILNAPTGIGKTLNLLNIGFKLKNKLERKWINNVKIVYGLPFTSIIDQLYHQILDIFQTLRYDPSKFVQKHHWLSSWNENLNEELDIKEAHQIKFLYQAWEKPLIVTTFYQIFYTIFGNKNKNLIKFTNFKNTIFLLDEIQATPYKYWPLFRWMFELLAEKYNSFFVLSSATLPEIIPVNQVYNLLPNFKKYFKVLNRTTLNLNLVRNKKNLTVDNFVDIVINKIKSSPKKSFLITLNTIKTTKQVYEKLKNNLDNSKFEFYYLSTHVIPIHRLQRIEQIKNSNNPKIVISTQLIEAGVDIDLDIWFRDFAPLDSIIQVLGRLNRNWVKKQWILYLVKLIREDARQTDSAMIYSGFLREKTDMILELMFDIVKSWQIEEKEFLDFFQKYFNNLMRTMEKEDFEKLKNYFCNLKFSKLWKEFKLIQQSFETIDIFVIIDEKAEILWQKFEKIKEVPDLFERKIQFEKIKKDFNQYVINVSLNESVRVGLLNMDWESKKYFKWWIVPIKKEFLDSWYDIETGFKFEMDSFI